MELIRGCCHRFLAGFRFQGTEPVCNDPPCVQSTRRADRRYRHDCTDDGHVALLEPLKGLPCQVMVSGHPSALHDAVLPDWRRVALQVTVRARAGTEVAWLNFEPGRMHSAGHAGRNATDRQRIKRKAARWAQGCSKMPPGERLAAISAIMAVEAG